MQFASLAGGSSIKVPNIVCTHGGRSFPPLCASLVAGSTGSGIRSAMVTSYNGGGTDDHGDLVCAGSTSDMATRYGGVADFGRQDADLPQVSKMKLS